LETIRAAMSAGVDCVQIREKDMPARELLELARQAVGAAIVRAVMDEACAEVRVVVNDRLDIALTAGAAGVHLGRESVPARDVIQWCRSGNAPAEFLVGVSCHSLEDAREAERAGASYIFFGPVFDTPSKRALGPPQGIGHLAEICRVLQVPVIAIGGVNQENGAECFRMGAAGVAAIRLFQETTDPTTLADIVASFHRAA
jgi:thiamine-phosphate pyrophosphorylase